MSGKPPRKGSNRKNVPAKSGGNPSTPAMSASGSTPSPKPAQWPEKAVTTAVAPSSSSSSSVAEVTASMSQVQISTSSKSPNRPLAQILEPREKLTSNFYRLQIPDRNIYQYDVTITPAGNRPAATNRRIFEAWKALPSHSPAHRNITRLIAYDGQNLCYSPKPMTSKSEEDLVWDVDLPSDDGGSRSQKFKVKFQSASEIEMVRLHEHLDGRLAEIPRDTFMALETILRYRPATLLPSKSTKSGGGSFFQVYKEDSAVNLYGGLSLQHGWYQATRATIQKMLMLNLDVSATTFYTPGCLLYTVEEFFECDLRDITFGMFKRGQRDFERFLNQISIDIQYREGRKRYKIRGFSAQGANLQQMTIPDDDLKTKGSPFYRENKKKTVTVEEYYHKMFKIKLDFPYLPVVLSGEHKQIHIPIELCFVKANQRYVKTLGDSQLAAMIKETAKDPQTRFKRIEEGRRFLHSETAQKDFLNNWGVKIADRPEEVDGRVLDVPTMNQGTVKGGNVGRGRGRGAGNVGASAGPLKTPNNGVWTVDLFFKPAELRYWSVLVVGSGNDAEKEKKISECTFELSKAMDSKGMKVQNWKPKVVFQGNLSLRDALSAARQSGIPSGSSEAKNMLILVVLFDTKSYHTVKLVGETELGIMTQCCQYKEITKKKYAYFSNISLKINTKLDGVNNILVEGALKDVKQVSRRMNERVMIFGADVTHPAPSQAKDPNAISIAAVSASVDEDYFKHRVAVRSQKGRQERISDIGGMVTELVMEYRANNQQRLPNTIIFYRDGVSEGQFDEILLTELPEIRKAFAKLTNDPPKITFIIMNKRHHARFVPVDSKERDKSGNVPAGTVVDTRIVNAYGFDFYLTSHPGLQGTSRPTYYYVLSDENSFTADELQELTYRLCYLFSRCSRSVSLVPAAYYAHLAAFRSRSHAGIYDDASENDDGSTLEYGTTEVTANLKSRMYFV